MIMILAFEVQNALPKLQFQTGKLDLELCACTSFSSEEKNKVFYQGAGMPRSGPSSATGLRVSP